VDIKHCHGYLLHEFLSAHNTTGSIRGSLENRTRMLRDIVGGHSCGRAPKMAIGVPVERIRFCAIQNQSGPRGTG